MGQRTCRLTTREGRGHLKWLLPTVLSPLYFACGSSAGPPAPFAVTVSGSVVEAGAGCHYSLTMNGTLELAFSVSSDGATTPGIKDTAIMLPPRTYAASEMMVEVSPSLGGVASLDTFTASVPGAHIATCPVP